MTNSSRVQSMSNCVFRSLKYIWNEPFLTMLLIGISTVPMIVWNYFLDDLPFLLLNPSLYGAALAGILIVAGLLATIAQYTVSKRCYRWLRSSTTGRSHQNEKVPLGMLVATVVWSSFLLGLLPGIRPIIFTSLQPIVSTMAMAALIFVERILGWLMMVFLFFYMWPVLIVKRVGPFRNMALTLRTVAAKITYVIPLVGWIIISSLVTALKGSHFLNWYGILADLAVGILQLIVCAYQMVAFYTMDSQSKSLELFAREPFSPKGWGS